MFSNAPFWQGGPEPGAFHEFGAVCGSKPVRHTLSPMVTGTSVLGLRYKDGIIIAADTLGSYGSMARYKSVSRIMRVNDSTVMTCGGDYADFQYIKSVIEQQVIDEECLADGFSYTPKSLFSWLTRVMYNRRTKMNPLWNTAVIGGLQNDKPFLGYIDKLGVAYEAPSLATGYGAYIAQPLMRAALEKKQELTEAEARAVIDQCLTVLYYRDARSWHQYEVAVVTKNGSRVDPPRVVNANWSVAHLVGGYE